MVGLFVPVPFYVGHRFFPKLHLNRIVTPALCAAIGVLSVRIRLSLLGVTYTSRTDAPLMSDLAIQYGITSRMMSYFFLALFSQLYLRKRHPTLFRKYNYLFAAALDVCHDKGSN